MRTYDQHTIDSAGTYLVSELERLDRTLHLPLSSVTWNRDIDLRSDVTLADEASSFLMTSFAAPGGITPGGKNWISGLATEIPGISVDSAKKSVPMRLWGMQLAWSLVELARGEQLGRPIDQQKTEGMRLKYNMDVDEMIYVGDTDLAATGLINNPNISPGPSTEEWDEETPAVTILADINALIETCWQQSAYAVCPTRLLLPPLKFGLLTQPVTAAGSRSILNYVAEECLANRINGRPLEIMPLKWLSGAGASNVDRAVCYTKSEQYVRYPMVPLQRTPVEYRGIHHLTTYYGTLGEVEFVYPETVAYMDGL